MTVTVAAREALLAVFRDVFSGDPGRIRRVFGPGALAGLADEHRTVCETVLPSLSRASVGEAVGGGDLSRAFNPLFYALTAPNTPWSSWVDEPSLLYASSVACGTRPTHHSSDRAPDAFVAVSATALRTAAVQRHWEDVFAAAWDEANPGALAVPADVAAAIRSVGVTRLVERHAAMCAAVGDDRVGDAVRATLVADVRDPVLAGAAAYVDVAYLGWALRVLGVDPRGLAATVTASNGPLWFAPEEGVLLTFAYLSGLVDSPGVPVSVISAAAVMSALQWGEPGFDVRHTDTLRSLLGLGVQTVEHQRKTPHTAQS